MTERNAPSYSMHLKLEAGGLESNNNFQLNHERRLDLGRIVITTFETERSITLCSSGLSRRRLSLIEALRSRLLELVESDKDDVIMLPPATSPQDPQLGQLNIPPRPSPQHHQVSINIFTDTMHTVWKEVLQPGHTYGLRFSKNNGEVFACYTDDEFDGRLEDVPATRKLPVEREGSTYCFTVRDDPEPPRLFARLKMPRHAHLTGPIPFTFVIEYTTDSLELFVIDKSRSPLSVFSGDLTSLDSLIDCRDNETGEKVSWSGLFLCYDSDPHPEFPHDDDFIEISADKPWQFECTIENLQNEDEYVRSMEGLEAGRTYKARVAGLALITSKRWQYGKKGDLLEGTQEEKMRKWEVDMYTLGYLRVERIGDDVHFETVA
jgi:hypothetical protein